VFFPTLHTEELNTTILHLKNLTVVSINNINVAVAFAIAKAKSDKKGSNFF
jgi:hypothetical protein